MLTQNAKTILPFPADTEHQAVLADIKVLWNMVVTLNNAGDARGKALYAEARALFSKHNTAVNPGQDDEAQTLQAALRTLLGQPLGTPADVLEESFDSLFAPAAAAPVAAPPAVQATLADEEEQGAADPEGQGGDGGEDGDGEDSGEETEQSADEGGDEREEEEPAPATATSETPASAPTPAAEVTPVPRTVEWDAQALGSGLISGLANTLRPGDALQLVVVRTGEGELTVNIIPRKLDGEPGSVNADLTVRGTPAELDLGLLDAMPTYQEVRKTVRELAADLLEQTQRKTLEAKANAAKPAKTAGGKPAAAPEGTLKIDVTNPGLDRTQVMAVITGKGINHSGKLTELVEKKLPPGTYSIEVSAERHDIAKANVTVRVGKTEMVKITLKPRAADSLF